jgi:pyochelin synthetase
MTMTKNLIQPTTLVELLRDRAQNQPDKRAYTFLIDGETKELNLTYAELDQRARTLAAKLQRTTAVGERALLLYPAGLDFIVAFFGCLYAGVVAVPTYPPRRNRSEPRLQAIAADAQATQVLTTTDILSDITPRLAHAPELKGLSWLATDNLTDEFANLWQSPNIHSNTLAFLQYTSGSTGTPKGVMVSHGNVLYNEEMFRLGFQHTEKTIGVGWLPLFHDMGLMGNVLQPLYLGIPCILMSPFAFLQKPYRWLQAISSYRATSSGGPNFAYELCVQKVTAEQRATLDLSCWEIASNGAEPVRAETLDRFTETFEPCGFRREAFYPCYGMAETTLFVSGGLKTAPPVVYQVEKTALEQNRVVAAQNEENTKKIVGCGRSWLDQKIVIVDPESFIPCTAQQVGEIWVSGPNVGQGYWNRREETKQTFQASLAKTGEGPFLRTGDLGFLKDGELFVTGRLKALIIIRGRNYYPQDIELTVESSHPALNVGSGAAFSVDREGEAQLVIVQEVQRTYLRHLDVNEVVNAIRQAVFEQHELGVNAVLLLKTATIPKTSSGKIQRRACKELFLAGHMNSVGEWQQRSASGESAHDSQERVTNRYVAPRTATEEKLANLWAEVIGTEQVGIYDNFFELGGYSLLATQLISRISDTFSIEISLHQLFESPILADLAAYIETTLTDKPRLGEESPSLPTIKSAPEQRYQPFPLTDIQQAYWLGRSGTFELGNVAAHIYFELECRSLDLERLTGAWQTLIQRHDMLRMIVLPTGQQQVLEQVPPYQPVILDLRGEAPQVIATQLETLRQHLSHQVLPAEQWPLFEILATRLDEQKTRLHLSFDALIADAWSLRCLLKEWLQLYQNPALRLTPVTLLFRDYVLTEQAWQDTEWYQRAKDYWFKRINTLPLGPELPLAKNPATVTKPWFKRRRAQLVAESWQILKQRATQAGLTPSGVLLAAFADILTVWSKRPGFTINLTLFNRPPIHPQLTDIIGDFTSVLLLAVDNTTPATFKARALRLQQQLWQDLDHRYFSGVRVQREMARSQETQKAMMPVVFTSTLGQDYSALFTQFGEVVYSITQTPQVWLDHQVFEQEGALVFNWDAVEELFPEGLLDDMFEAYCRFLRQLATSESAWLATTPSLVPSAQLSQRAAVNATTAPISDELLHTLFLAQLPARGHESAVISPQRTLTYLELSQLASQVGRKVRQLGATPNTLVAIVMEKGWEQVVAVFGVLMSGAAYLPIDPELPKERQWYLIEQGQVKLVLTQSQFNQNLEWPEEIQRLCLDDDNFFNGNAGPIELVQTSTNLAYVIFTSGSTGQPKGVAIDHRGAVNTIKDINQRFGVGPEDRVLALSALSFDLSVYDLFGLLAAGGTVVIPEATLAKDPAHWVDMMTQHHVTVWNTVPALMQMLVAYIGERPPTVPKWLRLAMMSGDWIPLTLPERIKALWPSAQIISLGGATEASIWSISYPIDTVEPTWNSIPYGKPLTNQTCQVLNHFLEPCPVWVPGQLYIGGIGLAQGYWGDHEKTQASFIIHPHTQARLYKTGDLGRYLPEGNIEFLGREDFQVKIRGYRIELGEIEAALEQHTGVKEVVVTVVEKERGGPQSLVAYLVLESETLSTLFEVVSVDSASFQQRWQSLLTADYQQAPPTVWNLDRQTFSGLWKNLDELYTKSLYMAFGKLGIYNEPGQKYRVSEIMSRCQIVPRYRRWLTRALQVLVEEGWLQQRGDLFESVANLPTISPKELSTNIQRKKSSDFVTEAGINWLIYAAENLAEIITENLHSAQIYTAENIPLVYQQGFAYCHALVKEVMRVVVRSLKPEEPLRILEVGAGYGSTTLHVLPLLPPEATFYYFFTDISNFFLQKAQKEFAAYSFVRYGLLNLDNNPEVQGYERHAFDVVIAASVLHDTRRLENSLQYARSLLAPGGLLLAIEETKFFRSFDLGMGLQQGFDQFEDDELRAHHPLLSTEQWQSVLAQVGFVDSVNLTQPGGIADLMGFDVLVAQVPFSVKRFNPSLLGDYLQQKLPDYMRPSTYIQLDALPLTPNGKVDRQALPTFDTFKPERQRPFVAPRTLTEEKLVAIFSEVLGIEPIGIDDNFFERGGDSLLATQLLSRVRNRFQIELPLRNLFEKPTIVGLAERIDVLLIAAQHMQSSHSNQLDDDYVEEEL